MTASGTLISKKEDGAVGIVGHMNTTTPTGATSHTHRETVKNHLIGNFTPLQVCCFNCQVMTFLSISINNTMVHAIVCLKRSWQRVSTGMR
jgi:hypothetical protein